MNIEKPTRQHPEPPESGLLRILVNIEDVLLAFALVVMIVLASSQILLRNIADTSLVWADPVLRNLVLWVGLLGAMVASQRGRHINIDLLQRYLGESARCVVRSSMELFTAAICGLVSWHSLRFVLDERGANTMVVSGLPTWVAESILPLAFAVMALSAVVRSVIELRLLRK